jgi:hypothetical protein
MEREVRDNLIQLKCTKTEKLKLQYISKLMGHPSLTDFFMNAVRSHIQKKGVNIDLSELVEGRHKK